MKKIILLIFVFSMHFLTLSQEKDSILESVLDLHIDKLMTTKVSIATKSDKTLQEAPSIVTVIDAEDIANSGARTLRDLLQYIPNMEFTMPRSGVVNVGIRGIKDPLTNARLLVLKDGVPYNDIMYGIALGVTKSFDLHSIERIEIIRGPGSALYGRNAFSGVMNIITKKGKAKNQVDVYGSLGNFNSYDAGFSYQTKQNDLAAYLSVEKIKSDITDSPLDNGMGGESIWNLGFDNLFVNTKIGYKNLEFTGMLSHINNNASIGPFATKSNKTVLLGLYSLNYHFPLGKHAKVQLKLSGRNEDQTQHISILTPDITAEAAPNVPFNTLYPNGMYVTPAFESYTYSGEANIDFQLSPKHSTLLGIQVDNYGLQNVTLHSSYDTHTKAPLTYEENGITIFRGEDTQLFDERGWIVGDGHDYRNISFYFQEIYTPIKNISFTLGGRYDIDSEFGGIFNPRLAFVWNIHQKIILKLLHGQAYRAPSSQEQYRITGFTIGNPNLKPETIKTNELAIDYLTAKNILNRVTMFYNVLDNMIYAQGLTSGEPGSPYSNIGSNESMGIEYEYRMSIQHSFQLFFNYSYTLSENTVQHNTLNETFSARDIAPHKANLGFNYRFLTYFHLNSNWMYRSEREKYFAINTSTGDYILDTDGNKTVVSQNEIGNYVVWNAKLRILHFFKSLELSAEAYNILNTEYYDQDTEYAYQPKQAGSQYIFSLKYTF